jgi:hypothetical protein
MFKPLKTPKVSLPDRILTAFKDLPPDKLWSITDLARHIYETQGNQLFALNSYRQKLSELSRAKRITNPLRGLYGQMTWKREVTTSEVIDAVYSVLRAAGESGLELDDLGHAVTLELKAEIHPNQLVMACSELIEDEKITKVRNYFVWFK